MLTQSQCSRLAEVYRFLVDLVEQNSTPPDNETLASDVSDGVKAQPPESSEHFDSTQIYAYVNGREGEG